MNISASGKILLLLAAPLFLTFCSRNEELLPDNGGSEKTVTLTLRSAESVSAADTRTSLAGNGQVLWSDGDFVTVGTSSSYESYPVIPDPENPAAATVEGVPESDEYVVIYPYGSFSDWPAGGIGDYVSLNIDSFQRYSEDSFATEVNPMAGYGTSTDIELKNVASVARFGITGTQAVTYLTFAANDGSNLAGNIMIPVEDLRSGVMSDSYSDFSDEYGTSIVLECVDDEYNTVPVQLSSEPTWFHFVVPAKTYDSGFTLYVIDSEKNLSIKKMTVPVEMPRSTVVPVEPFEFEPIPEPEIEITGTASNSISYTVTAVPGTTIMTGVAYKSYYDSYPAGPDGDEYTQYDIALETVYNSPEGFVTVGDDGTCTFTATKVCNYDCEYVDMVAATDYYVIASYAVPGDMPLGTVAVVPASTEAASGEGPAILDFSVLPESTYSKLAMNIALEGEVSVLQLGLFSAAELDGYIASGMEPRDVVLAYGKTLDEASIETAVSGGLYYETAYDDRVYPATEYRLFLLAAGPDGAESFVENEYVTPEHFPEDAVWETVSSAASVTLSDYENGWTLNFNDLTAERLDGENIFRVRLDIYQNDFSGYMTSLGCNPTGEDIVYLYLDGNTSADIFATGMPEPVAQIFPEESYAAFMTAEGMPVYFCTSSYSMLHVWENSLEAGVYTSLTSDYTAEENLSNQNLFIRIPFESGPASGSMSNEDFQIQEETPWE